MSLLPQHRLRGDSPTAPERRSATLDERIALRRLRYHLDLLESGYRQAMHPDYQVPTQRTERIALGIDRPELDTIPLWSVRRADGSIAIPFIETVLRAIRRDLEAGARAAVLFDSEADNRAREGRVLVDRLLRLIAGRRGRSEADRTGDCFLPGGILERVCGTDSPLRRLGRRRLRAGRGDRVGHGSFDRDVRNVY